MKAYKVPRVEIGLQDIDRNVLAGLREARLPYQLPVREQALGREACVAVDCRLCVSPDIAAAWRGQIGMEVACAAANCPAQGLVSDVAEHALTELTAAAEAFRMVSEEPLA